MSQDIQIAVIGGGVIGCAAAYELSGSYSDIFLFEKNRGITSGENQSSRNSGVIHSGIYYDRETRPKKAALCVEGNHLLYDFCAVHGVPALRTGKLLAANSPEEEEVLAYYRDLAAQNCVSGVDFLPAPLLKGMEPSLRARTALFVPSAGIVEPTSLVYRLHTLALERGVHFLTGTETVALDKGEDHIRLTIQYPDGRIDQVRARIAVNAGGVYADLLARLFNPDSPFELDPVCGESYKFYSHKRRDIRFGGMNIYPTPEIVKTSHRKHFTVGVHLTPTFQDLSSSKPSIGTTVTVGPKLVPIQGREAPADPVTPPAHFVEKVNRFFPGLREEDLLWHQAGVQARLKGSPDFVIESDPEYAGMIHLTGIDSPGLTSCLSIAKEVRRLVSALY